MGEKDELLRHEITRTGNEGGSYYFLVVASCMFCLWPRRMTGRQGSVDPAVTTRRSRFSDTLLPGMVSPICGVSIGSNGRADEPFVHLESG